MGIAELILIAAGLSMDAFAVSVSKGLAMNKINFKTCITVGIYFGVFQAAMPGAGYFLGSRFYDQVTEYSHWIAFVLLAFIGGKMIKESFSKDVKVNPADNKHLNFSKMLPLAVATSIDALAVGVTFAFIDADIVPAVSIIGIITFSLSAIGVKIGNIFGCKYKSKAELTGGIILLLIGIKILAENLSSACQ